MTGTDAGAGLQELLLAAATAHHDATGGPDPEWRRWYAEFLEGRIDRYLDRRRAPDADEIEEWLSVAATRHQGRPFDEWPETYAGVIAELAAS